jgi:hypothetical protein
MALIRLDIVVEGVDIPQYVACSAHKVVMDFCLSLGFPGINMQSIGNSSLILW